MAKQVVDVFEVIGVNQQQAKLLLGRSIIEIVGVGNRVELASVE